MILRNQLFMGSHLMIWVFWFESGDLYVTNWERYLWFSEFHITCLDHNGMFLKK